LSRPRLLPQDQDQDQDQDSGSQDQDFIFCPRRASRPRFWSRGLHHCTKLCPQAKIRSYERHKSQFIFEYHLY